VRKGINRCGVPGHLRHRQAGRAPRGKTVLPSLACKYPTISDSVDADCDSPAGSSLDVDPSLFLPETVASQLSLLFHLPGGNMAIDVYLQIDGIKGESMDDTHKGWIECSTVSWGIHQPKSATASTGGGHTAERVEMANIVFRKEADLSSPILMQTCSMGKTIPKAEFEFMRADGQGKRIKYFEIDLENVLIGMVTPSIQPGAILIENIGLMFSKVKWQYTQQKIGGGSGGNTAGSWNLSTNAIS
jgi:type VI secretion system secreted protein Hcp